MVGRAVAGGPGREHRRLAELVGSPIGSCDDLDALEHAESRDEFARRLGARVHVRRVEAVPGDRRDAHQLDRSAIAAGSPACTASRSASASGRGCGFGRRGTRSHAGNLRQSTTARTHRGEDPRPTPAPAEADRPPRRRPAKGRATPTAQGAGGRAQAPAGAERPQAGRAELARPGRRGARAGPGRHGQRRGEVPARARQGPAAALRARLRRRALQHRRGPVPLDAASIIMLTFFADDRGSYLLLGVWGVLHRSSSSTASSLGFLVRPQAGREVRRGQGRERLRWYAAMRAVQLRLMRLPKPQVKRGQLPSLTRPRRAFRRCASARSASRCQAPVDLPRPERAAVEERRVALHEGGAGLQPLGDIARPSPLRRPR